MRHKERRRKSKLKLRPYGVITVPTGEPGKDQSTEMTVTHQTAIRASDKATKKDKTIFFLSLLKGLTVLLLIAIAIGWANNNSFSSLFQANTNLQEDTNLQDNTTQASSSLATDNVDPARPGTTSTENETNNSQSKPIKTPVTSENSITTDEKSGTAGIQNSTSEAPAATTRTNQENPTPVDSGKRATQDTNTATIDDPTEALQTDNPQPETAENTDNNANRNFIKAYKASVFSSLAADATETPVQHGTAVIVLERTGDWVKIEVTDTGITGFIHITHLSIQ